MQQNTDIIQIVVAVVISLTAVGLFAFLTAPNNTPLKSAITWENNPETFTEYLNKYPKIDYADVEVQSFTNLAVDTTTVSWFSENFMFILGLNGAIGLGLLGLGFFSNFYNIDSIEIPAPNPENPYNNFMDTINQGNSSISEVLDELNALNIPLNAQIYLLDLLVEIKNKTQTIFNQIVDCFNRDTKKYDKIINQLLITLEKHALLIQQLEDEIARLYAENRTLHDRLNREERRVTHEFNLIKALLDTLTNWINIIKNKLNLW